MSLKLYDFIARSLSGEAVYCKDWHIVSDLDSSLSYSVPILFEDDWLNYYCRWKCRGRKDDYIFAYIGGPKSFTNIHFDVMCSFSWSINLSGKKRWTFWSPIHSNSLYSSSTATKRMIVTDAREGHYDEELHPKLKLSNRYVF